MPSGHWHFVENWNQSICDMNTGIVRSLLWMQVFFYFQCLSLATVIIVGEWDFNVFSLLLSACVSVIWHWDTPTFPGLYHIFSLQFSQTSLEQWWIFPQLYVFQLKEMSWCPYLKVCILMSYKKSFMFCFKVSSLREINTEVWIIYTIVTFCMCNCPSQHELDNHVFYTTFIKQRKLIHPIVPVD